MNQVTTTKAAEALPAHPVLQYPVATDVRPSKTNPRKIFAEGYINELAESIKVDGVLQPILCREMEMIAEGVTVTWLEIVAGECRWRATIKAGIKTIPALVRKMTDLEALKIQVIENLKRKDLHPLEEAEGLKQMMAEHKYTADQLAQDVGKSKAYIYARIKLCDLEQSVRKSFFDDALTASAALLIARIPVPALQAKAAKEVIKGHNNEPMSQREIINHLDRHYMLDLKKAPFKSNDENLLPQIGSCVKCPKRTGNQAELFSDVKNADVCTDPNCFESKSKAWTTIQLKRAKEEGKTVIEGKEAKELFPSEYSPDYPGHGFHKPSDICYADPKNRTYGQLAKLAEVAPVVAKNPHKGIVVELIKDADIKSTLKELGTKPAPSSNPNSAAEKKAKTETKFRTEVFNEIRANIAKPEYRLSELDWHVVAQRIIKRMDSNDLRHFLDLLGWDKSMASWDGKDVLASKIETLYGQELASFIFSATLMAQVCVSAYSTADPEQLISAAERHGVDVSKIKARLKAEEKAKADAKKKPATKKAEPKPKNAMAEAMKKASDKKKTAAPKSPVKKVAEPASKTAKQSSPPADAWPFPKSAAEIAATKAVEKTSVTTETGAQS